MRSQALGWGPAESPDESPMQTWERLSAMRAQWLNIARTVCGYVAPTLIPPDGSSPDDINPGCPSSSLPGTMANNLANIVMDTVFPDTIPFVSLEFTEQGEQDTLAAIGDPQDGPETLAAKLDEVKSFAENLLMKEWAKWGQHSAISTLAMYAVTCGQGLGVIDEQTDEITPIPPHCFAIERMPNGTLKTVVIREGVQVYALHEAAQEFVYAAHGGRIDATSWVEVITRYAAVEIKSGQWVYQKDVDIDGKPLPIKGKTQFKATELPVVDFPWELSPGGNYGVGPCAKNIGDIEQLAALSASIRAAAAQIGTIKWAVMPGAGITPQEFAGMRNGDVKTFDGSRVMPVASVDYRSIAQAAQERDSLERNLAAVFLYRPGVIRDSERTTAFEIQQTLDALHQAGHKRAYQTITKRVQPTIAHFLCKRAKIGNDKSLKISVTGGSPALSRRGDAERFSQFINLLGQTNALPPMMQASLIQPALIAKAGSWFSIDTKSIINPNPPQLEAPTPEAEQPEATQ